MLNLGVQYYRPPFPESRYWEDDFARIRDSGLNTVQLWVLWSWVEPQPDVFRFEDYDRLFELAVKNNLGVIVSTIAEIHPYWIHRVVPGSEMIDHMGHRVVSSNRVEAHFGLTPGGCTDVPDVWQRMEKFFHQVVTRYRSAPNLRGWDVWNELRWNVQADGLVCFCPDTLSAFRRWLDQRYGGLENLNAAWKRRYGSFEEILPGKLPGRPYTEMMAFEHFITWRANRHGKQRYDLVKSLDPDHLATIHGGDPCILTGGSSIDHALNRGNDWFYADDMDGIGCSSFPKWVGIDDADFGIRVEGVKSAAGNKQLWLSEVQGGRSALGFNVYQSVDPDSQQRWIWNGFAGGASTILFWCWRDEVFGSETGGFGISGRDGLADERLSAMKITGRLLESHKNLLENYHPSTPQVGVLFSPQSYYLHWAQLGHAGPAMEGLTGYARALVRRSVPFRFVEEEHLDDLSDLKILFLPRIIVTDPKLEQKLQAFVEQGGTLVCESECGAFTPQGIYRDPADRFTAKLTGCGDIGRRTLEQPTLEITFDEERFILDATQWTTPLSKGAAEYHLLDVPVGKGRIVLTSSYFGDPYRKTASADFEHFVERLARSAGWEPDIQIAHPLPRKDSFVYVKYGASDHRRMIFVFFPENEPRVRLMFKKDFLRAAELHDLIGDQTIELVENSNGSLICDVIASRWQLAVLVER